MTPRPGASGLRELCRVAAPLLLCAALLCAALGVAAAALWAAALGVALGALADAAQRRAQRAARGALLPAPRARPLAPAPPESQERAAPPSPAPEQEPAQRPAQEPEQPQPEQPEQEPKQRRAQEPEQPVEQRVARALSALELAVVQEGAAQRRRMGRLLRRSEARMRHFGRELQDGIGRQAAAALAASAAEGRRALRAQPAVTAEGAPARDPGAAALGPLAPPPRAASEREGLRELIRHMTYLVTGLSQQLDGHDARTEERLRAVEQALAQLQALCERLAERTLAAAEPVRDLGDGLERIDARLEALRGLGLEQQRLLGRALSLRQADQSAVTVAIDRLRSELASPRGKGPR